MASRARLLAALLVLVPAGGLVAQEPEPLPLALPSGVKARVSTTAVPGLMKGIVVNTDGESLTLLLEQGSQQKLRVEDLTRLDVAFSQKRQTLKGAIIGTAVGLAFGFLMDVDPDTCEFYESTTFCSRGDAVLASGLVFAGLGAGIGALVKTDRWSPVNVDAFRRKASPMARGARGPSLSFTVRF